MGKTPPGESYIQPRGGAKTPAMRDQSSASVGHSPLSAWQNHAMPTSEELLELANRCAAKLELDGTRRHVPSFSDAEEQCEDEYETLLQAIHEDELFAPVDIQRQEQLVEQIAAALPEDLRTLIVELADNHARHVWLQQEGAYHVGLAVGHRLRLKQ